jgi:exosortase/archaeosortase family protein
MPLAVAGNFARIIMLTLGTITLGPETAIGSMEEPSLFHQASGFLVFGVALGGMLGVGWLLQRISPEENSKP